MLNVEIATFWPHVNTGRLNGPLYRLIVEIATFWHHIVNGPPNGPLYSRDAKRCDRCDQCSCKDFSTGVKILVENVMKGGVNKCQVFVTTAGNQKCLCL